MNFTLFISELFLVDSPNRFSHHLTHVWGAYGFKRPPKYSLKLYLQIIKSKKSPKKWPKMAEKGHLMGYWANGCAPKP